MKSPADRIASAPDTITDRLCAELRARAERGVEKYGVTLDAATLTPAQVLQHAKEEALDLAAYLQKLIDMEAINAVYPMQRVPDSALELKGDES